MSVVTQIWQEFLSIAREEAGSPVVETWFKAVSCLLWEKNKKIIYLKAPNQFVKDWIVKNHMPLLHMHLSRLLSESSIHVQFVDQVPQPENHNSLSIQPHIIPAQVVPGFQPISSSALVGGHRRHELSKG